MKARKEIADYIKQRKIDRAKIRVRCGSCDLSCDYDINYTVILCSYIVSGYSYYIG